MNHIKKHVLNKQFLYTICFIAFAVIDWTRGSQVGPTWAWTVNMTGVVMAAILFTAYRPREFVKPVYLIYSAVCIAALPLSSLSHPATQRMQETPSKQPTLLRLRKQLSPLLRLPSPPPVK